MHCEGCAKKVKRSAKGFKGVKGDCGNNKLTVVRKIDPLKIRERIE
uniref:HMA domain-containing protein n=1 Tax=Nelumbo nucifera TaxID=4432 RepID=A0A822YQU5_NELNU|nr:TPA_asm: hypothetical protein HUJ06_007205 [Nelumbo nucifera]